MGADWRGRWVFPFLFSTLPNLTSEHKALKSICVYLSQSLLRFLGQNCSPLNKLSTWSSMTFTVSCQSKHALQVKLSKCPYTLGQRFLKGDPRTSSISIPWELDTHSISRTQPQNQKLQDRAWLNLLKPSRWFCCMLKYENCCLREPNRIASVLIQNSTMFANSKRKARLPLVSYRYFYWCLLIWGILKLNDRAL
jgi:hypothetical protein